MSSLSPFCRIVDVNDAFLRFDCHCPLLSLPLAFRTGQETIPRQIPYLAAEPDRISQWKARIGPEGFKIGICWQGGTAGIDIGRSFPLRCFENLSRIPGVRLIGLHKGKGEAQLGDLPEGMVVESFGEELDSGPDAFIDTAAVMTCCDLVISSDTSIAHLAGSLGIKTWMALKYVPEWRWQLDREDSPWYPSMRLFRQERFHDWDGVFQRIGNALLGEIERNSGPC
jgi:hypothetical protein